MIKEMSVIIKVKEDCMICLEEEGEMVGGICDCITTRVHKKCLNKWIYTKNNYLCEICNKIYSKSVINQYIRWRLLRFKFIEWRSIINMIIVVGIVVIISVLFFLVYKHYL